MSGTNHSTALLFFSRSLEEEVMCKTLLEDSAQNATCISSLMVHSLGVAKKSGLPVFNYHGHQQCGNSFGERISNAFQDLFNLGFTKVISIGNDCPDISVNDIKRAETQLESHSIVLGPDQRGGTFLIGLSSKAFKIDDFAQLDWQTSKLISSFHDYADQLGFNEYLIDQKIDINNKGDVEKFASISQNLYLILKQLFVFRCFMSTYTAIHYPLVNGGHHTRRGPPVRMVF